jgi:hypothetical protein
LRDCEMESNSRAGNEESGKSAVQVESWVDLLRVWIGKVVQARKKEQSAASMRCQPPRMGEGACESLDVHTNISQVREDHDQRESMADMIPREGVWLV